MITKLTFYFRIRGAKSVEKGNKSREKEEAVEQALRVDLVLCSRGRRVRRRVPQRPSHADGRRPHAPVSPQPQQEQQGPLPSRLRVGPFHPQPQVLKPCIIICTFLLINFNLPAYFPFYSLSLYQRGHFTPRAPGNSSFRSSGSLDKWREKKMHRKTMELLSSATLQKSKKIWALRNHLKKPVRLLEAKKKSFERERDIYSILCAQIFESH